MYVINLPVWSYFINEKFIYYDLQLVPAYLQLFLEKNRVSIEKFRYFFIIKLPVLIGCYKNDRKFTLYFTVI
jgi:hypothetical protein